MTIPGDLYLHNYILVVHQPELLVEPGELSEHAKYYGYPEANLPGRRRHKKQEVQGTGRRVS
jgi:hypothetical protein